MQTNEKVVMLMDGGAGQEANSDDRDGDASDKITTGYESSAFATELLGPLRVAGKIFLTDSRPGILNRLDEVLQQKWGLQKVLCFDVEPSHLSCTGIAW